MSINDDASFFIKSSIQNRKLRVQKNPPHCISIWIIDLQKKNKFPYLLCSLHISMEEHYFLENCMQIHEIILALTMIKIFVAYCMCTFSHVTFSSFQFNSYIIIQCFSKYNSTRSHYFMIYIDLCLSFLFLFFPAVFYFE